MSKKLNIIEAMKMPIGTEFEVEFDGEKIPNNTMIVSLDFVGTKEYKTIDWKCHPNDSFMRPFDFLINGVFIPIQQPVSFMEVVNSEKRCRVEHRFMKEIKNKNVIETVYNSEFEKGAYLPLNYLMCILGGNNIASDLKQIIKEGKWYLEDKIDE